MALPSWDRPSRGSGRGESEIRSQNKQRLSTKKDGEKMCGKKGRVAHLIPQEENLGQKGGDATERDDLKKREIIFQT